MFMFCRISKMFPQYCSKNFNQLEPMTPSPIYCKISLRLCLGYPMTIWRYIRKITKCNIILFTKVIVLFYFIFIYFTIFFSLQWIQMFESRKYMWGWEKWSYKKENKWKHITGPGIEPMSPVSLARCSTTNPPRTNLLVVRSHIYRSCHQ